MNKKLAACCTAAVFAALTSAAFCGCKKQLTTYHNEYYAFGSYAKLVVTSQMSEDNFNELSRKVSGVLYAASEAVSVTSETSCVYAFNAATAGESVELNKTAYDIFKLAKDVYIATDGYYNPAVYLSGKLYGFTQTQSNPPATLPPQADVEAFRLLSTYFGEVELTETDGKYYAKKPDRTVILEGDIAAYSLKIDLSGIVKGWCADEVEKLLTDVGVEYGYFDFGSSSMEVKKYASNKSGEYTLHIDDPRGEAGSYFASVSVSDTTLSTSGDNRQYYELDGVRYCHIINPQTGSPIQTGIASVTIIGGSAAQADALTTALSAMGKERAIEYIKTHLQERTVIMLTVGDGGGEVYCNHPEKVTFSQKYPLINDVG